MKTTEATIKLFTWAQREDWCVFRRGELARILGEPRQGRAVEATVSALVRAGTLDRVTRNVYVVPLLAAHTSVPVLDQIAQAAGDPYPVFESLETAASQWGMISQVFARGASYVTPGRSRTFSCDYGMVSLVHTSMNTAALIERSVPREGRRSRITNQDTTLYLLRRTGRMSGLVAEHQGDLHV